MILQKGSRSFWKLQIVGWLIYLLLIYVTFFSVAPVGSFLRLLHIKSVRTLIGFLLTCLLWQIYRRYVRGTAPKQILPAVVILSIVFGIAWTALESTYSYLVFPGYSLANTLPRMPRIALDYSVTILAWSAIYFGIRYWRHWQNERENALKAGSLADKAQLEMLRYQLNPHFLFNALNSIRASVDEDSNRAKGMITQLSEFLRHSLLSGETKEVPLREELEAVRNYLAIEKIRFEDRLEINFDIAENVEDEMVPCFLLNPLVENSIKHGLATSPKPLQVRICASRLNGTLRLEVTNSGRLTPSSEQDGTKIGLKNVRERLERLFSGRSKLELSEREGLVSAVIEIKQ